MLFQLEKPEVSPEILQEQVSRFLREERPRRARLTEYYRGQQGVRKGPIAQGRPNNQLTANFAKYITDVHTGYFVGVPPTLTFERRRAQERVGRALEEAGLEGMLYAAARDMSVCGEGYLLTYLTAKGPRLARLDPLETFVLTCGVRQEPVAAVRVSISENSRAEGELYLPGEMRVWEKQGKRLTLGAPQSLPFTGLPVTRFCNNLDRTGDFEPVCSLLDEARALLEERALSTEFAPLLTGADSAATRARVEQFERHYAAALQQQLAARLPVGEPRDFAVTRPARRRTGIRRV